MSKGLLIMSAKRLSTEAEEYLRSSLGILSGPSARPFLKLLAALLISSQVVLPVGEQVPKKVPRVVDP